MYFVTRKFDPIPASAAHSSTISKSDFALDFWPSEASGKSAVLHAETNAVPQIAKMGNMALIIFYLLVEMWEKSVDEEIPASTSSA
ncbi:hypothetical protein [Ruegeria faecimaris]|uniref:hypothetical protein n=1 Tax=Ruegeria faecimaris TaxID=686389 RepID=UPI0011575843|nr:hypothetical protein [Ruegeria faecimaris]